MSDKGYLSNRIENTLAKLADNAVDFNEKKKLFGLFKLEKNDFKLFKAAISFLDDKVIGKNPNAEIKAEIDIVLSFVETNNIDGFIDHIADLLTDKINLNLGSTEKQIYLLLLQLVAKFIDLKFEKIGKFIDEANTPDKV